VARVDGHGVAGQAPCRDVAAVPVGDLLPLTSRLGLADRLQLLERALPHDPVRVESRVLLEVQRGTLDLLVVHAALRTCIEPQQVQLDLERQHVVAAERGFAQVEQPVSEGVAGLHELAPCVGADACVGEQAPLLLEREYGQFRVRPEESVDALPAQLEALAVQPGLDVEDFFAAVAAGEVAHRDSWSHAGGTGHRLYTTTRVRSGRRPRPVRRVWHWVDVLPSGMDARHGTDDARRRHGTE